MIRRWVIVDYCDVGVALYMPRRDPSGVESGKKQTNNRKGVESVSACEEKPKQRTTEAQRRVDPRAKEKRLKEWREDEVIDTRKKTRRVSKIERKHAARSVSAERGLYGCLERRCW